MSTRVVDGEKKQDESEEREAQMPSMLMHGLVGYMPSPRRTNPPATVRLSELSAEEYEKAITRKAKQLPRYARSTLRQPALSAFEEVKVWETKDETPPRPPANSSPIITSNALDGFASGARQKQHALLQVEVDAKAAGELEEADNPWQESEEEQAGSSG